MIRALWSGATGMKAQSRNIDVIANNLANVNTSGFKKSKALFSDLQYDQISAPGLSVNTGVANPTGIEVGHGVKNSSVIKIFSQGEVELTERSLDLTIEGEGFFKLRDLNGNEFYTRNGAFTKNNEGIIVNTEGLALDGVSAIPQDTKSLTVGQDGTVSAQDSNNQTNVIGQIQVYTFPNSSGLSSRNGATLYEATTASGVSTANTAGANGAGKITSGMLELSNVQAVEEMVGMIKAQRAYELNSRSITTADQMLQEINNLKR